MVHIFVENLCRCLPAWLSVAQEGCCQHDHDMGTAHYRSYRPSALGEQRGLGYDFGILPLHGLAHISPVIRAVEHQSDRQSGCDDRYGRKVR